MYGILERQFRNYVEQALKTRGNTGEKLFSILEKRLDNVVFRLGFVPTRPAARQVVSHRHTFVNGKRVNIPSFQVRVGDAVTLSPKALEIPSIKKNLGEKGVKIPSWLERKGPAGRVVKDPVYEDIIEQISMADIVEFYSR